MYDASVLERRASRAFDLDEHDIGRTVEPKQNGVIFVAIDFSDELFPGWVGNELAAGPLK